MLNRWGWIRLQMYVESSKSVVYDDCRYFLILNKWHGRSWHDSVIKNLSQEHTHTYTHTYTHAHAHAHTQNIYVYTGLSIHQTLFSIRFHSSFCCYQQESRIVSRLFCHHTPVRRITVHRYSGGSDGSMPSTIQGHTSCSPRKKIIDPGWTWRSRPRPRFLFDPPIRGISMTLTSTDDSKLDTVPLTCSWTVRRYSECDVSSKGHLMIFIKIKMIFWRCLILIFYKGITWFIELQSFGTQMCVISLFLLLIRIFKLIFL